MVTRQDEKMKGKATGKKAALPDDIKEYLELYQVFTARAVRQTGNVILTSPEVIFNYIHEYFDWSDKNPMTATEYVKAGNNAGTQFEIQKRRPKTLRGFCLFLGKTPSWFYASEARWKKIHEEAPEGEKELPLQMVRALEAVRTNIDEDCDAGALSGIFDPKYMAMLRGLREIKDVTSKGEAIGGGVSVNVLTPEAIEKINKIANL